MNTPMHPTYWDGLTPRPTQRYVVIFTTWRDHLESRTITEYPTLAEAREETKLLNIFYSPTPAPIKELDKGYDSRWNRTKFHWSYPEPDSKFWGWLLLDMTDEKLLDVGGQGMYLTYNQRLTKKTFDLSWKDKFFRGPSEVPSDYQWDDPWEYQGWLQYRWGDGKNGLTYQEPPAEPKPWKVRTDWRWDDVTDQYVQVKEKYIVVPWDDPLPKKKLNGVIYERPNGEPVHWPGEFGYEGDYNLQPWSLEEESVDVGAHQNREATQSLADSIDMTTPGGLKLALLADEYRRKSE